eukprot:1139655-Pelagomonas_calceolata.AAC.1
MSRTCIPGPRPAHQRPAHQQTPACVRTLQIASEEIFDESDLDALAASAEDTAGVQSRLLALALIIWG